MLFRRTKLLGLLHQSLPDKEERILTNKHVTRIETHDDGVSVLCKDGSIMEGSIVVGCDGVHSRVRQILREKQLLSGQRPTDSKKPMKTTYNGLVGLCPLPASLKTGTVWECRGGKGRSFHILTGPEDAYFFVYQRLDKPHYERPRYTDEDAEALARNVMDHPVTDHLKFSDLWKAKKWATLVDYQEGFLDRWCGERVVLVGDSVHKATPNAGLSLNTGWQGMAELTNRLRALLLTDASPDTETLTALFEGYQESRKKIAKATMSFSGLYTRVVAWDNAAYRFADWLAPKVGGDILLLNHLASPIISRSITFDFVEEKEHKEGKIRWKNPPKTNGKSRK
jgi:2-polyprenyl-6-methoxyphenol hydroxylase-like FAD-dependent oxidoreductase